MASDVWDEVRDYLDSRPREVRYRAALRALRSIMIYWLNWAQAHEDHAPRRVLRAAIHAQEGVQRWLDGNSAVEHLDGVIVILTEAARYLDALEDDLSAGARLVLSAARALVFSAYEEATGLSPDLGVTLHPWWTVMIAAELHDDGRAASGARPRYVDKWLAEVEMLWPDPLDVN